MSQLFTIPKIFFLGALLACAPRKFNEGVQGNENNGSEFESNNALPWTDCAEGFETTDSKVKTNQNFDRILAIMDSNGTFALGYVLDRWFRNRPQTEWELYGVGGSAPYQWNNATGTNDGYRDCSKIKNPPVQKIGRKIRPFKMSTLWKGQGNKAAKERRVSLIFQGTNHGCHSLKTIIDTDTKQEKSIPNCHSFMSPNPDVIAQYKSEVNNVTILAKAASLNSDICIWVGPPHLTKHFTRGAGFKNILVKGESSAFKNKMIREGLAAAKDSSGKEVCYFIDATKYTKFPDHMPGNDGIHYSSARHDSSDAYYAQAESWIKGVSNEIEQILAKN